LTIVYDSLLKLKLPVWLYLHPLGSLKPGAPPPRPSAVFSGICTAVNYTEFHPIKGIPAEWGGADYVIEEDDGVFRLTPPIPHTKPPIQSVFRLDGREDSNTIWVSEIPLPREELITGKVWTSQLDPGFERFFTRASLKGRHDLVHRPYRELKRSLSLYRQEVGDLGSPEIASRLHVSEATELHFRDFRSRKGMSTFIYRAKYKI
jgi:hypothetical protein